MEKDTNGAIYTRAACESASGRSSEDQITARKSYADSKGVRIDDTHIYSDAGISGATITSRDGLNRLLEDAQRVPRSFEVIITEDTSRLSRNLADALAIMDMLEQHGVSISFVAQGFDSSSEQFRHLLMGRSAIDESYIKHLSYAVRRGQAGRVAQGLIPGGCCYGYDHVYIEDPSRLRHGRPMIMGVKAVINEAEAANIRLIFKLRGNGLSYHRIATLLNAEHVPLPKPRSNSESIQWFPGQVQSILNNTRYLGRILFGHTRRVRSPYSGKTVIKHLPPAEWLDKEVPELRIVSDEQWRKAHERREPGGHTR
jgi:DNA invertase Pin-like site-specific DNA recombinase